MKLSPFFFIGFLLMNVSAFAELSVGDLGKIEAMFEKYDARMREFVGMKISEEIGKSEKRMQDFVEGEIAKSEKRTREFVSDEIEKQNVEIAKLPIRMDGLDKQQDRNFLLLLALLAFIGVVVGLPQLRERRNASAQEKKIVAQQQQIDAQQQQIDAMQKELETLKQHQMPST